MRISENQAGGVTIDRLLRYFRFCLKVSVNGIDYDREVPYHFHSRYLLKRSKGIRRKNRPRQLRRYWRSASPDVPRSS